MVNSNAFTAWRLFQLNWIPIAAMGVVVVILTMIVATFALRLMFRTFEVSSGKGPKK